jgi:predicted small secreted protein
MKRIALVVCALFALALFGCNTTENANEKIKECLEEEYGADQADELMGQWEITCEDDDENCQECVDCVLDEECEGIFDGACDEACEE